MLILRFVSLMIMILIPSLCLRAIENNFKNVQFELFTSRTGIYKLEVIEIFNNIEANKTGINLISKSGKKFIKNINLIGVGFVSWSKNDKYALIDSGTGPIRGFCVIDLERGKYIGDISGTMTDKFYWDDDSSIIIQTAEGDRIPMWSTFWGVAKFEISKNTITKALLFKPEELTDYKLEKSSDGFQICMIEYKKNEKEHPAEIYQKIKKTIVKTKETGDGTP